jgi:hypothetical protein
MEKSVQQIERNVSASFGYVKKDMLMLNDAFSDIHEKMQQLSLNNAMLLEEVGKLRTELVRASAKPVRKVAVVKKVKVVKKKK